MTIELPAPADAVTRVLPRLLAAATGGGRSGLLDHEELLGPLPLPARTGRKQADRARAERLIDVIERSGLTGRGGAGFPAGRKLRSVAAARGGSVVVANGAEGEPASAKDKLLLARAPNLVLDGISLAAYAVGADRAYLAVHETSTRLVGSLEGAIAARQAAGIDPVPVTVVTVPDRYVASEQSAIVQRINGGPALPTFAPPRTHEKGVGGRPTLVHNVETLAHLSLIARFGDRWFRSAGTPAAAGTMLVTISGAIARPGVYEIQLGTPVGAVCMQAGGPTEPLQAILTGGFFGTWLPAQTAWPLPLTLPDVRAAGGTLGAGVLIALPAAACGLAETARVVRYLAHETARQCGPCVFGLPALADELAELAYCGGRGAGEHIRRLIPLVAGRGACRHPDGATQLARSAMQAFGRDARWHQDRGPCPGLRYGPVLPVPGDLEAW
jgi:NADH:ubiquinone oxidoreductase subunit F (NADH-binding)